MNLLGGVAGAGTPAHIQSVYGQLVTSSTLTWQRSGTGFELPEDSVPSGTGTGVVCRGRHHGTELVGKTELGRCRVGFNNRLVSISSFYVLTQVPYASKLEWKRFARFAKPPQGAVSGVDGNEPMFIARRLGEKGVMDAAVIELAASTYGTGVLKVYDEYGVVEVDNGDILVELEPVRYELKLDEFDKDAKRTSARKVLASSSIFRFMEGKETTARMQKMLTYTYQKSRYFGQVKGTIKGLPARISLPSGEVKSMMWGMEDLNQQEETMMVGHSMTHNSAVDVVIRAMSVKEEQPYTGTLVAVFADGSVRERRVEGVQQIHYLDDIQPQYSKLYVIKDQVMGAADNSRLSTQQYNPYSFNNKEVNKSVFIK